MASHKGAYVTNINEFINSSYQRYHHKKYIQHLQYFLKLHQRNRRSLPDPAQSINSKNAKRPLPTSPCFQKYTSDLNRVNINRPISPGRSVLSSPRSRSRGSSPRAAVVCSALSNFNTITCFSNSNRTPTPQLPSRELHIPTVIVTSEGNQQLCPFENRDIKVIKNMAASSVHPVERNTSHHANHIASTNPMTSANQTEATHPTSHLRKVTFKLPETNTNNSTLHAQRSRSAPLLYRSTSLLNCSTFSDEQNEMPIQLRNQRNLPQKPLNKHPMSPTIPIAKLRLFKELNSKEKDNQQQQDCSNFNSTMYNVNHINPMNNYNNSLCAGVWPQRNAAMFDSRYSQNGQFGPSTGLSKYSHSLPNSPSKRPMYNPHYNHQLHQPNQRHLSMPSYQPVDCYTVGSTGILSSHGSRFPLGTIPPLNSTSPHNFNSLSPQTSSLPTYSQVTKPSFLDVGPYSHRTGHYNPFLYDKALQRLKQRIPVCKSAPLSSIMANSLPSTNQFTTHDSVTGLPRRRHTSASLSKSNLSPKTNLGTGQLNKTLFADGTIEQDSPLTQMRKEIKYFVDERKRQLEQGTLDINNLNNLATCNNLTIPGKYLGSNSNLSNSTAIYNDQSPLSGFNMLHTSPNITSAANLAQNRNNYLSSSESDLNALLNLYSYPPDPVLERVPPAGTSVFQRLPQYYLNRTKNRYTVDDLRRNRHPLIDYYDDLFNQYYGNQVYDPLLDRNYYQNQLLPTSTYHSLVDWPSTYASYTGNTRPSYYASTGSLRALQTPNGLNGLNSYSRSNLTGANNNYRLFDQNLLGDNYLNGNLSNDYHHYSLDTLGLDRSYSRPASPYYNHSTVPPPAPISPYNTQHSLSTNHLDSLDLNNNLLSKSMGHTTSTLPLRSYRL